MKKPTITIRMSAPEWSITTSGKKFDLRSLDTAEQRKAIFTVVKFCRDNNLVKV